MAGLGMLGTALAGAVKGGADVAVDLYKQQNEFDLKKTLLDAEFAMRQRLEEAGIKSRQTAADEERGKVSKVIADADAADPDAGKGGYETPEMKAKSDRAMLERRREGLTRAGYLDEADRFGNQIAGQDKAAMESRKTEAAIKKDNAYADMYSARAGAVDEEIAIKAKNAMANYIRANRPTGSSAGGGAGKPIKLTDKQAMWADFRAKHPEEAARTTFGEFVQQLETSIAAGKRDTRTTTRKESLDADGNRIVTTSKSDGKAKPAPATGREDPLGLFKK